jgi:predicted DNA binding CopG/RHH family protein
MQRVNFHLTEAQMQALRKLADKSGLPVAELIRRAVDKFLGRQRNTSTKGETP